MKTSSDGKIATDLKDSIKSLSVLLKGEWSQKAERAHPVVQAPRVSHRAQVEEQIERLRHSREGDDWRHGLCEEA